MHRDHEDDQGASIVCLTPVRDEAWLLERFLTCASTWADHIIIADQGSTDASRKIASRFPKVISLDNPSASFNEPERQKLLIDAARRHIAGRRLLFALDADEAFSANCLGSAEFRRLRQLPPGTAVRLRRANLLDDLERYWLPSTTFAWGYMDDGQAHVGRPIHSPRLPVPRGAPSVLMEDVKVLHYQFTDMARVRSKHRWYQCWEALNRPHRSPIEVFRQYHHADGMHTHRKRRIPSEWFAAYEGLGIDMRAVQRDDHFWWDEAVLDYLELHGTERFASVAIWDHDWQSQARSAGRRDPERFRDPRTARQKALHIWLTATLQYARSPAVAVTDLLIGVAAQRLTRPPHVPSEARAPAEPGRTK